MSQNHHKISLSLTLMKDRIIIVAHEIYVAAMIVATCFIIIILILITTLWYFLK